MFYVYRWYIKETNETIYVGKGTKNRYRCRKRNKLFNETISKYICEAEILKVFETENEAFEYEHYLICDYKNKGECKCNLDNGGIGGCNFVWTKEMREYYSKYNVMKSQVQRERMSKNNPMKDKEISKKVGEKHSKPFYIGKTKYNNLKEASLKYKCGETRIEYWLKTGKNTYSEICYYEGKEPNKVESKKQNICKKIIYKDKIYNSIKELANELGVSSTCLCIRLKKGFLTNGEHIRYVGDDKEYKFIPTNHNSRSRPVILNGIYYSNILTASKEQNIPTQTLCNLLYNKTKKSKYKCEYANQQPSTNLKD